MLPTQPTVHIYQQHALTVNCHYPLSYRVPVRERYGSTLLPATREQHDQIRTEQNVLQGRLLRAIYLLNPANLATR